MLHLVERESELRLLDEALSGAADGRGRTIVVEGPAGVGKSVLLAEGHRRAASRGMLALAARGHELEREFPFGVVRQLFERHLRALTQRELKRTMRGAARLCRPVLATPAVGVTGEPETGFAVLHGLYWLVANLADSGPLLLAVDDAHWADEPSLQFLTMLSARVDELPVLLVLATRPESERRVLARILAAPGVDPVRPAPLSELGVAQVLGTTLQRPVDPEFARACHAAVAGNPLLLAQLVVELERQGIVPNALAAAQLAVVDPVAVSRSPLARLACLPPGAANLARAVAVLGDRTRLAPAAALAELDLEQAASHADELVNLSILESEGRLSYVHPIVREAVYRDMGAKTRALWHRRAADLLAEQGAIPERVAAHLLAADPAGDCSAVRTLVAAAADAKARGAPDVAAVYLRRALEEPPETGGRAVILHELGRAEALAGQPEAAAHLQAAIALTSAPLERARIVLALAVEALLPAGRYTDAVKVLDSAIADLGDRDAELSRRLEAAFLGAALFEHGAVLLTPERLQALSPPVTESPGTRALLVHIAGRESLRGGPVARFGPLVRRALGDGALISDGQAGTQTVVLALHTLSFANGLDEALAGYNLAIERAQRAGSVTTYALFSCFRALVQYRRGELAEAEADARLAGEHILASEALEALPGYALAGLVDVLIDKGSFDEAAATLERAGPGWDERPENHLVYLLSARGRLRLASGDAEGALGDLLEAGRRHEAWGMLSPAWDHWRPAAALAHLAMGQREQGRALAGDDLRRARAIGDRRTIGVALRAAALCEGGERGLHLLREGVSLLAGSPARLEHARLQIEFGAALRRANRRGDAKGPLAEGAALAAALGATALAERAREELAAIGVRTRAILRDRDALTASERRVVRMAAEGMTNREIAQALFVTLKTVETHLGRAYRKLGVRSRSGLRRALADGDGREVRAART
jgi:DNA-binding CsgD family transcriptional regulator